MVSSGLYQQMGSDTLQNNLYLGPYRYGPMSAHSLTQWFADDINVSDDLVPKRHYDDEPTSFETAEFQQDTETSREQNLS